MKIEKTSWHVYACIHRQTDPAEISRSLARDQALDALIDDLILDRELNEEAARTRFRSLCRNRFASERHRIELARNESRKRQREAAHDSESDAVLSRINREDIVTRLRKLLSDDDAKLLIEVARGRSLRELAMSSGMSVSALKSKIFRAKERVRGAGRELLGGERGCITRT